MLLAGVLAVAWTTLASGNLAVAPAWHAAQAAHNRGDCAAESDWLAQLPKDLQEDDAVVNARTDALVCAQRADEAASLLQARLAAATDDDARVHLAARLGHTLEQARVQAQRVGAGRVAAEHAHGRQKARNRLLLHGAVASTAVLLTGLQLAVLSPALLWGLLLQDLFLFQADFVQQPVGVLFFGGASVVAMGAVALVAGPVALVAGVLAFVLLRKAVVWGAPASLSTRSLLAPVVALLVGLGVAAMVLGTTGPLVVASSRGFVSGRWNPTQRDTAPDELPAATPFAWWLLMVPPVVLAGLSVLTGSAVAARLFFSLPDDPEP